MASEPTATSSSGSACTSRARARTPAGRRRAERARSRSARASPPGSRCPRRREELPPAEEDDRGGQPPHGLRGGELPERRRVLGARDRHLHDPRRRLHPPLRLLQRADRQADLERPAGAAARRQPGQADGAQPRGRHLGGPRRPPRLRRERLRRRDPLDPQARPRLQGRGPDAGLPRPGDATREGDRGAPRRLQPQRRDRAPPLSGRQARIRLHALGARPADGEGDGRRGGDPSRA